MSRIEAGKNPEAVSMAMMAADRVSGNLGMIVEEIREGYARMAMTVREDMQNGLGVCHGGIIFCLADSTFAFACNSRNVKTVALNCVISFLNAANVGDKLIAEAIEKSLKGRTGLYDISVRKLDGTLIAEFRGTSYGTSSPVID